MKSRPQSNFVTKAILFIVFSIQIGYAQVGIGTTDPQADLHIAGDASTIRIDGLNSTNNANNLGGTDTYPVHVDTNGDLVVLDLPAGAEELVSISQPVIDDSGLSYNNIRTGPNAQPRYEELTDATFTLTRPALVIFTYSLSYEVRNYNDNGFPTNGGRAKRVEAFLRFGTGGDNDNNGDDHDNALGILGTQSESFSNATDDDASFGYYYITATAFKFLQPGTHSVHLWAGLTGGSTGPENIFSVNFGSGGLGYISAYAIY
ncbi:hypothetical protein GCM10011344_05390 [Dokdonia pacifica]|uniref:Uncharacterized protein n=1 Tax=Dokdonia pacifica TaxID=1627892 RepID=A0A238ZP69_9FLAO|nr:hypothetical protein [Dokdonia pacifica]GGG07768.1 hypothetical protein GCM10011344_05390 [Dokdonia pacifica]SNR85167.1 hypothetical protein SAMN06265376_103405 [Dokdonia pacifica]